MYLTYHGQIPCQEIINRGTKKIVRETNNVFLLVYGKVSTTAWRCKLHKCSQYDQPWQTEVGEGLKNTAKLNMSSAVCASAMYKSLAPTPKYL